MKKILLFVLIAIVFAGQALATDKPVIGYAAFFYFNTSDNESDVYDDFFYYLSKVKPWLADKNIDVSFHTNLPIELKLKSGQQINFNELKLDLGFILIKPNGHFKVYYGVHPDIDIQELVKAFFEENTL